MKTYIFSGRVLPERSDMHMSTFKLKLGTKNTKFDGKANVSIGSSQISVVLEVDTEADIFTMKNAVEHLVGILVDSYGYITGRGYDIEITSVVDPDGKQTVFGVNIPEIEALKNDRPLPYGEVVNLALTSKELQHALSNLREAIRCPWDTGFFCYRAVECIRQYFKKNTDNNEAESWKRLRKILVLDKDYFKNLLKHGVPQRHGEAPEIKGVERVELMKEAWVVVDKFVLYLKSSK